MKAVGLIRDDWCGSMRIPELIEKMEMLKFPNWLISGTGYEYRGLNASYFLF